MFYGPRLSFWSRVGQVSGPACQTQIGQDKGLGPKVLLYVDIIIKLTYEVIGQKWERSVLISITGHANLISFTTGGMPADWQTEETTTLVAPTYTLTN